MFLVDSRSTLANSSYHSGARGLSVFANNNAVRYTLRTVRVLDTLVARKNGEIVSDQKQHMKKLNAAIDSSEVDPESMDQMSLQAFFSQLTAQDIKDADYIKTENAEIPDEMNPLLMTLLGEQMTYGRNFLSGCCKYSMSYGWIRYIHLLYSIPIAFPSHSSQ